QHADGRDHHVVSGDLRGALVLLQFGIGLQDYLQATMGKEFTVTREIFAGKTEKTSGHGSMEWAITWYGGDPQVHSYCNTIP
ncbi:hypothetical protein ACC754_42605, partial [Rhizobium johnstonii]